MNVRVRWWTTKVLLLGGGCFQPVGELTQAAARPEVETWSVRDTRGATWPALDAPRSPHVRLHLSEPLPARWRTSPPLYLLRGTPEEDVLDDLADPPLRKATQALLVPLEYETTAEKVLEAGCLETLDPGASYTLVWAHPEGVEALPLRVSRSPAAGARLRETWPAHGSVGVAPNLRRLLLRFDGYLDTVPGARLQDEDRGTETPVELTIERCGALGFPDGDCVWLAPSGLSAASGYAVHFTSAWVDATGVPIEVPRLAFRTGEADDASAPNLLPLPCAKDEAPAQTACALASESSFSLRARADEPVLAQLLSPPRRASVLAFADAFSLSIEGFEQAETCLFLRLTDLSDNRTVVPFCVTLPADLAPLSIDEVLVDPLGPEPAQEYVELLNFGTSPVSMQGFSITSDVFAEGLAISESQPVQPGERVLLVGPSFERRDPSDAPIPDALRLVRLSRPLSLRNEGVELLLRDSQGRRLSASPRVAPARAGQCLGRVSEERRSGRAEYFALDPHGCSPGGPTQLAPAPP